MDSVSRANDVRERWPDARSKARKFVLVGILSAMLLAAMLSVAERDVDTSNVPREPTPAVSNYLAVLKGEVDIESGIVRIAASRDGILRDVLVNEGDQVRKGQVLASLDDAQARLQLDQARRELSQERAQLRPLHLRLKVAQREHARLVPLVQDESVARQELDQVNDQLELLQAEIALAEAAVESASSREKVAAYEVEQRLVRAPLDGQVVRRHARPGDGVSTLNVTTLFLFTPASPQIVRAQLEERFVDAIQPGMPAQITLQADESQTYTGKVLRIGRVFGHPGPTDDPADKADIRTVECVLSIDQQSLRIGQRVLARVVRP
jgi:HlyD family secretion protein